MPVRARSRSSISAITCLPERLIAQRIELGVDAVAREAAVARQRRRVVDEHGVDGAADVSEIVEPGHQRPDERCLQPSSSSRTRGTTVSELQAHEVARAGGAERGARDQPFEILDTLRDVAKLAALSGAKRQFFDGVEAVANRLERDEWAEQPGAKQPSGHGGDCAVDLVEEGALRRALHRFDDLEMLQGDGVDQEAVG